MLAYLAHLKSLDDFRPLYAPRAIPAPQVSVNAQKVADFIATHASTFYSAEEIATVTRLTPRTVALELKALGYVRRRASIEMPIRFRGRRVWVKQQG
jgi:hypothetical protein